jgi:hypothetical protein
MKASVVEEVSDQSSISRKLHWVRWRLQYDDRPVIAVHQRSTAEDMIAPTTAMLVQWDDLSARRQVGGWGRRGRWPWRGSNVRAEAAEEEIVKQGRRSWEVEWQGYQTVIYFQVISF